MRQILLRTQSFFKETFKILSSEALLKYSASLAYYTVLSLAPMLIIIIKVSGFFWGEEALRGELYSELKDMIGNESAMQLQLAIQNIHLAKSNIFATVIGAIVLLVGATGIFNEIQDSLNRIWGLKIKTRKVWWKLLIDRVQSFSLIVSLGFVLIVSLILDAIANKLSLQIGAFFGNTGEQIAIFSQGFLGFLIAVFLFGAIFKVLPDARIHWKDVLFGAIVTALLFVLGKKAIGFYLGQSEVAGIYGAAGSIMVLMIWVYYTAIILYLGAVLTKVYAMQFGCKIYPNEYAVFIKTEEIPVSGLSA